MADSLSLVVKPKSASYALSASVDFGQSVFTNRGATGEVDFTLPTPSAGAIGRRYEFMDVANQTIGVIAKTAGDILTFNNSAATSVKASTASQKIGARITATCVESVKGTYKWFVEGTTVGVTYTVA